MNEIVGTIFISIGLFFNFAGSLGLVRLPDVYNRLQAATKCVTLGTCSILFGLFVISPISQEGFKAILCILFILLTSPTAAHAIARGAYIYGVPLWKKSVVDSYKAEIKKRVK
jgi:multicomponent Na+:H+ antiporter subunit G